MTVSREALMVVEDHNPLPNGVQARVLLNEDAAFLPDLGAIEEQIGVALTQAA